MIHGRVINKIRETDVVTCFVTKNGSTSNVRVSSLSFIYYVYSYLIDYVIFLTQYLSFYPFHSNLSTLVSTPFQHVIYPSDLYREILYSKLVPVKVM